MSSSSGNNHQPVNNGRSPGHGTIDNVQLSTDSRPVAQHGERGSQRGLPVDPNFTYPQIEDDITFLRQEHPKVLENCRGVCQEYLTIIHSDLQNIETINLLRNCPGILARAVNSLRLGTNPETRYIENLFSTLITPTDATQNNSDASSQNAFTTSTPNQQQQRPLQHNRDESSAGDVLAHQTTTTNPAISATTTGPPTLAPAPANVTTTTTTTAVSTNNASFGREDTGRHEQGPRTNNTAPVGISSAGNNQNAQVPPTAPLPGGEGRPVPQNWHQDNPPLYRAIFERLSCPCDTTKQVEIMAAMTWTQNENLAAYHYPLAYRTKNGIQAAQFYVQDKVEFAEVLWRSFIPLCRALQPPPPPSQ